MLLGHVVEFFANATTLAVEQVVDDAAIGLGDAGQAAETVVLVAGDGVALGFALSFAVGGVGVLDAVVLNEPVLGIVLAGFSGGATGFAEAVAVGIVGILALGLAVVFDFGQATSRIIGVSVGLRYAVAQGLLDLGDAAPSPRGHKKHVPTLSGLAG